MPIEMKGTVRPGEADRRYYMIRVQVAGRRVVVSSGSRDRTLAISKETEVIMALRANPKMPQEDIVALVSGNGSARHMAATRASTGLTLREAFDRCLTSHTVWRGLRSVAEYTRQARVIEGILGADTPLAAIDFHAIQKLTKALMETPLPRKVDKGEKLSGATVCNHLACLRRMFNVALEDNWPDAPKSFPKVKGVKKRKGREYFMNRTDETKLFDAVLSLDDERPGVQGGPPRKRDAHRYHRLFTVLLETGMRLNEGLGLLWTELDFPSAATPDSDPYQGMVELFREDKLKTGRRRSVPMTATTRRVLLECKGIKGGPFADLDDNRAQDLWEAARKRAGVTHRDCVIHCLRHTCASRLLKSGVDLKIVKDWLGHSSIATTDIYTHLDTEQLTGAAGNLQRLRSGQDAAASSASI